MADAAEKFGNGESVIHHHGFLLKSQGIPYDKIEEFQEFIAKEGLVTGGTGAKVRPVVSCKGTTCQYGLLDSYALSEEIYRRFYEGFQGCCPATQIQNCSRWMSKQLCKTQI